MFIPNQKMFSSKLLREEVILRSCALIPTPPDELEHQEPLAKLSFLLRSFRMRPHRLVSLLASTRSY